MLVLQNSYNMPRLFRFTRSVQIRMPQNILVAVQFAQQVKLYVNELLKKLPEYKEAALQFPIADFQIGMELFGKQRVYWQLDVHDLNIVAALDHQLLLDEDYQLMLQQVAEIWIPGTMEDIIVQLITD